MSALSNQNFGLFIAYVLPGFLALWGLAPFSATIDGWLRGTSANSPTVAGVVFVTAAAVALGLVINALRWLTIERIHIRTGIPYPHWDFSRLQPHLGAYSTLVEFYYRYHEFFGNLLIAVTFAYAVWRYFHPGWKLLPADVGYLVTGCILWLASRDTLRKYYQRTEALLCEEPAHAMP